MSKREREEEEDANRSEATIDADPSPDFVALAEQAYRERDAREREIEEYLKKAKTDKSDSDDEECVPLGAGAPPPMDVDPFADLSEDDIFGSSSSSAAGSGTVSDASGSDGDDEEADAMERLLLHAKATAAAAAPPTPITSSASVEIFDNGGANGLAKGMKGGKTLLPTVAPSKSEAAISAALKNLKDELLKPIEQSTALTIVNASDESADVMSRSVASKLPPPPPGEPTKLRKLRYVNHSTVEYIPIRKDFYVVPPDMKGLTPEEMKQLLKELDGAKIRGNKAPRPMRTWDATGLPDSVLAVLQRHEYVTPFAVQSIGTPCLMSGRDLLVTAKTGSGKTLSYALPLIRHCLDQPRCGKGEGPVGLVLVPTQELAAQVHQLLQELCAAAGLRAIASYGSTSLSDNIRAAKAGCEVMTCTPGRLLDLLTVNGGNTVTLRRASFAIIDEADRLFDSGFMEHVEAFLKNIRPDRQVAMISATMPKELKREVVRHMTNPLEISVGGKPTPASNVEQSFCFFDEETYEVDDGERKEGQRFMRLLQILGEEGGDGQKLMLVFVQRKEEVDEIMAKLSALGYRNRIATLYSGMDPIDREFALEHFEPGKQFILIATAVAERGLDIPFLQLVVNYTLPNHYEAYVHRIGRTGRAGRKGRAISFFVRGKDDDIAVELVEGLERAEQQVPEELYETANKLRELRREGGAQYHSSFYRGYRKAKRQFYTNRNQKDQVREAAKAAGLDAFLSSESDKDSDLDSDEDDIEVVPVSAAAQQREQQQHGCSALSLVTVSSKRGAVRTDALVLSSGRNQQQQSQEDRIAKALAFAQKTTDVLTAENADDIRFQAEYPINDLPDIIRGKLQSAGYLREVMEETNTTIIKKGVYFDPKYKHSLKMKDGEQPLYLLIIGKTDDAVRDVTKKLSETKSEILAKIKSKTSSIGAVL